MPSLSSCTLGARALSSPSAIVNRVSPALVCRVPALLLAAACCLGAAPVLAQSATAATGSEGTPAVTTSVWDAPEPWRTDRFYFQTSRATVHWNPQDDHNNNQKLVYGEWRLEERWLEGQVLVGAAAFSNSFYQPSQFVFGGCCGDHSTRHRRPTPSSPPACSTVIKATTRTIFPSIAPVLPRESLAPSATAIIAYVASWFSSVQRA